MSAAQLWAWTAGTTVVGALLGFLIYSIANRVAWSLPARIASGLAGAALGTFAGAGAAMVLSYPWQKVAVLVIFATFMSVGLQRLMFHTIKASEKSEAGKT
jgi:flagellar motor component MotA